ncbi:hypothetical protein GALL_112390 [mine drainage metagenome]|uniref:Uncharacterized protein n=1 Tax=mine drainage metagenome TaxID=410659 RepID=A0A1J5SRH5_9ZZZZ
MTNALPSFQRYQQAFCAHLRDPMCKPQPEGVPTERMAVYKEIVFNNLFESVSACFPVAQKVLGKRAWLKLTKTFLREHSASSPLFREIPEEFLEFLATQADLPPYLVNLCHYEWVELQVMFMSATVDANDEPYKIDTTGDLLTRQAVFTPAMQLLSYDYAVQKIAPRHIPKEKCSTHLLVYRNTDDIVKFIELNAVTYKLIELLQQEAMTSEHALTMIASELKHPQPEIIIQFGLEMLEQLRSQGVILGIKIFTYDHQSPSICN